MPPYEPVHIAVNRANPARKRIVADVASEQPSKAKQKRQPPAGQKLQRHPAAMPAMEDERATRAPRQQAGSHSCGKDSRRAAEPAEADPAAPPSKRRYERQAGPRGANSGAAASTASRGAQRPQGSENTDVASAAAAAQRKFVSQTARTVKALCDEAERFSGLHWDTLGFVTGDIDSVMVSELHELQERLEDALELPALTSSMTRRIKDAFKPLRLMNEDLMEDNELCTRPGCWHCHVDSDTDVDDESDSDDKSAEQNGLWAQLGCAYDNPQCW